MVEVIEVGVVDVAINIPPVNVPSMTALGSIKPAFNVATVAHKSGAESTTTLSAPVESVNASDTLRNLVPGSAGFRVCKIATIKTLVATWYAEPPGFV